MKTKENNESKHLTRRDSLKYITLGSISLAYLAGCETPEEVAEHHPELTKNIHQLSQRDLDLLKQSFFTDEQRESVRQLANLIIPADDRSGNAEDAGVTQFIEFMMLDKPELQNNLVGGLKWVDVECLKRYSKEFRNCSEDEQKSLLDDIAYPDKADPQFSQGVAFFNSFRDYVSTGFWSSQMGIEDLQYTGNVANAWKGAPQEWLDRLGVSYDT